MTTSSLFKIARFKTRYVSTELQNYKLISNLVNISTPSEMEEFTILFMALDSVNLTDQPDTIK
jgi:hypothetical protein